MALLDAGGFFGAADESQSSLEDQIRGDYLVDAMSTLSYDAVNLGGQDVRFGEDFLTYHLSDVTFPVVSSNLQNADGSPYVATTTRFERGGYSVGVVGVLDDGDAAQVAAESDAAGEPLQVAAMADAAASAVAEVASADLVVLLAFMAPADAEMLAMGLPDVDVVVHAGGNLQPSAATELGSQFAVGTGYDGKWVVRLDLDEDGGAWSQRSSFVVSMDDAWPDDPEMDAHYQAYLAELAEAADEIVAGIEQEVPAGGSYVGSDTCAVCHPSQTEQWQTTPHSHAFETLVETNHDYSPSCYACHTVGFGFVGGFLLPEDTPERMDVGCESCHGAGEEHVAAPGPGWGLEPTDQCLGCHTPEDSPQFDMGTYLPQVVH